MDKKKWRDLEPHQQRAIIAGGVVQATLALSAWYDLSHRPRELVNGPKAVWALVIAINFIGPLAYFRFGRHRHVSHKATPWHEKVQVAHTNESTEPGRDKAI